MHLHLGFRSEIVLVRKEGSGYADRRYFTARGPLSLVKRPTLHSPACRNTDNYFCTMTICWLRNPPNSSARLKSPAAPDTVPH